MNRHVVDNESEKQHLKNTLLSALVVALANMGDTFLYAYLPANYKNIGVSVIWIGVILSINKFTRLFLNGWVAYYLSKKGIRTVTIITTIIAVITTISYGIISSVFFWILARILWGISFSTLRLGSLVYALQHNKKGISLGLSRGIIELGSVFALLIGPLLVKHFDEANTFCIFGLISFIGVVLAFHLPNSRTESISKKDLVLTFPSSFNTMVLINAFIAEGILVVLISSLVQMEYHLPPEENLLLVSFILGFRRICLVVFAPLAGWFADKLGFQKIFLYTTILLTFGILLISLKFEIIGIIIVFAFNAMNASIAAGGALNTSKSLLKDIADNATWRDIGSAFGSLVGALLITIVEINFVFIIATVLLLLGIINHYLKLYKNNNPMSG